MTPRYAKNKQSRLIALTGHWQSKAASPLSGIAYETPNVRKEGAFRTETKRDGHVSLA